VNGQCPVDENKEPSVCERSLVAYLAVAFDQLHEMAESWAPELCKLVEQTVAQTLAEQVEEDGMALCRGSPPTDEIAPALLPFRFFRFFKSPILNLNVKELPSGKGLSQAGPSPFFW